MRIVHFSNNSLAGAPRLIVDALNAHTPHHARLVDARRYTAAERGWFGHDLVFSEDPEACLAEVEAADVLHLHNFLDLDSRDFAPLDFRALARRKLVLRQLHSLPALVASRMGRTEASVLDDGMPALVIAHYPERFHPRARVVPNLVPLRDPRYTPRPEPPELDVFFGPSKPDSAWENRWNTKGAPETAALLADLHARLGLRVEQLTDVPRDVILARMAASRLVLDDMANGSIHLSGLQGLSLGRAVAGWLDPRQQMVLRELTGAPDLPWINVRLEEAGPVLAALFADADELAALGRASRAWMERWCDDAVLVGHFVRAYEDALADPTRLTRQPELALDTPLKRFVYVRLPELAWAERGRRARALAARA
ncbi:MAG: glycosyltransferase family 1 protein [Desulfovibrionaceae bacterium]